MGDVVNLKRFRKQQQRAEEGAVAAANRARFGRPKAEKDLTKAQAQKEADRLDGHRLPDGESPGE
jgi:hypothetical protein